MAQERREVPRDRGIGRERQAELAEPGPPLVARARRRPRTPAGTRRAAAPARRRASAPSTAAPPTTDAPDPSTDDGDALDGRRPEQPLLRRGALAAQRLLLAQRQPRADRASPRRASRGRGRGCRRRAAGGGRRRCARSAGSPSAPTLTMTSVKSVVPPPTSQTSRRSPSLQPRRPAGRAAPPSTRRARRSAPRPARAARGGAASTVSSRASSSKEAGTVSTMAWRSKRRASPARPAAIAWFHASRTCARYAAEASTGEHVASSSALPHGRMRRAAIDLVVAQPRLRGGHEPRRARARPGRAPTRRRRPATSAAHGSVHAPRPGARRATAGRGTTAASARPRPRLRRRPAGRRRRARAARRWPSPRAGRRRRPRSSSCPGRCR